MVETTGQYTLRAENVDRMVKAVALQEFKMKQVVSVDSSSAWIETYYREGNTELTGGAGENVKGIPRGAAFPYGEPNWTKVQAYMEKYGMEGMVAYEDALLDKIDVIARTILRVGRAVAYAVDTQIYSVLSAAAGNSVAITAGYEWDSNVIANRDPISDIINAKRENLIDNYNMDNGNGYLLLNPTDYANILKNSKVTNNPSFKTADVVSNGKVGQLCGLSIIVSPVVTADQALVLLGQECGTWKSAAGLTTFTIEDKGIKYTIRAYEMGVLQATAPNCICKISNTAA